MRLALAGLVSCLPAAAFADACQDRFHDLVSSLALVEGRHEILSKGTMGTMATETRHHYVNEFHYLVETVQPPGMPDTLMYEGGWYNPDGNGGWALVQQIDMDQMQADGEAMREAQAEAITEAQCSTETRDGRSVEVVEGTIAAIPPYNAERTMRYVIDTETDALLEHGQSYDMNGMQTDVTFTYTPSPDLVLPIP